MNEPLLSKADRGGSDISALEQTRGKFHGHLVDAEGLRLELFKEGCRPSLAWIRRQTRARTIPAVRIGRLIFYDPPAVREKLARKNTVKAA